MSSIYKGTVTKGGGSSELPEEGQHMAVIVAMVDLGTHIESGFQGAPDREVRKCHFSFELVNEKMDNGQPFIVGSEYTSSLHQKSKLVQMLQKVRGREYTDGESIDVTACVGKPCQVLIAHKQSSSGRTYARVADVTAPPKGSKVKSQRTPFFFIMDEETEEDLTLPEQEWLPYSIGERLADKIARSPEWKTIMGETSATAQRRPVKTTDPNGKQLVHASGNGGPSRDDEQEQEIPF